MLEIPNFTPNLDLDLFLITFKCPYCKVFRIAEININKKKLIH